MEKKHLNFFLILDNTRIIQINLSFIDFRKNIISTINSVCTKFTEIFENFDISYKKFCYINFGKKSQILTEKTQNIYSQSFIFVFILFYQ